MRASARHRLAILLAAGSLAALGPAAPCLGQDDELKATVRLEPVGGPLGLEETAFLVFQVEAARQGLYPDPTFELENFRIVAGPSQSTEFRFANGVASTSYALTWQLQPKGLGTARVRAVRLKIGKQTMTLADQAIEVVAEAPARERSRDPIGGAGRDPIADLFRNDPFEDLFGRRRRPARAQPPEPKIFLRAEAIPASPWVGQQVLYTLHLFTTTDIHSVNPREMPDFQGFWATAIPQPDQLQPEWILEDGERCARVVLLQRALFPRRAGDLEVPPITAQLTARIPDGSPFGALMPRAAEISRTSNPVQVAVRELPPPPPGFHGMVGRLELQATVAPTELEVGAAATLTLSLDGRGHLQGIPDPTLPEIPGVQVFAPQQHGEDDLRGTTVHGTRTWSFVLVPQRPGRIALPPIEMPYFDPASGSYEVARTAPLTLVVRGRTQIATDDGQRLELHPIRTAALPAAGGGEAAFRRAEPWLFLLPWGIAGALFVVRQRGGGRYRPFRVALQRQLDQAAAEDRPRQAAATIEEAWRDYLAERWQIARGTASPAWAGLLGERGVSREAAEELVRLADDLHYLRYAPKLSSTDEIQRELVDRSRRLLRSLG